MSVDSPNDTFRTSFDTLILYFYLIRFQNLTFKILTLPNIINSCASYSRDMAALIHQVVNAIIGNFLNFKLIQVLLIYFKFNKYLESIATGPHYHNKKLWKITKVLRQKKGIPT